jgi:hypothetical protein
LIARQAGRKPCLPGRSVGGADVRRLLALGAGGDVEVDALTFGEGLETLALDRGKMGEEIIAAALRGDEAEALGIVEPLHGTCCHVLYILQKIECRGTCPLSGRRSRQQVMKGKPQPAGRRQ